VASVAPCIFKSETKGLRDDEETDRASKVDDTVRQPAPPPPPAALPPREIPAAPRDVTDVQRAKDAERSER